MKKDEQVDEAHLKCRYCGSLDVARCGFRYNARGIARRYFCHDCQRKFSIPHVENTVPGKPAELVWLLNEVGMLISKLTDLVSELNTRITTASDQMDIEHGEAVTRSATNSPRQETATLTD